MMFGSRCALRHILLALTLLGCASAAGAQSVDFEAVRAAQQEVARLDARLEESEQIEQVSRVRGRLSRDRSLARECIDAHEASLEEVNASLEILEPGNAAGTQALDSARETLTQQREQLESELSVCKLLLVQSETLRLELDKRQQEALVRRLQTRERSALEVFFGAQRTQDWWHALADLELRASGIRFLSVSVAAAWLALTLAAAGAGFYARARLRSHAHRRPRAADMSGAVATAFLSVAARYAPTLTITSAWAGFWVAVVGPERQWPQIAVISFALATYVWVLFLTRSIFSPPPPAYHYLGLDETASRRFWRALRFLALVTTVALALFQSPFIEGLTEPVAILLRAAYAPVFVLALIWVVWRAFALSAARGIGLFRPIVALLLLVGLGAEWAGYRNLADYLVGGIFYTLLGLGLAWLVTSLVEDIYDSFDEGRYSWQRRLRQRLWLTEDQNMPGLIWLRLFTTVVIWGATILILLRAWGLSTEAQDAFLRFLREGFTVGSVTIIPSQLVLAVVVFSVVLSMVAWLKRQLDERWLRKASMERGAHDATITVSGYIGAALAGLVALAIAGVDFQSLAIIAGALSLGIGFGLQNIVNNFVSGLILLFERPIRVGDWILVGDTQGYVKRISIRSTQIQTFDLADVIVPNSQLVSEQVTNWMLRDPRGRVCIPVKVAYGSDTGRVKAVLLEVARAHPAPIADGSVLGPHVLFMGFGESALDFELRFYIRQVDYMLVVTSELNFALEAALREAGIEVPYPQREVHLRDGRASEAGSRSSAS